MFGSSLVIGYRSFHLEVICLSPKQLSQDQRLLQSDSSSGAHDGTKCFVWLSHARHGWGWISTTPGIFPWIWAMLQARSGKGFSLTSSAAYAGHRIFLLEEADQVVRVLNTINQNQSCLGEHTGFSTSPVSLLSPLYHLNINFLFTNFHKPVLEKIIESAPKMLRNPRMLQQTRSKSLPFPNSSKIC